MVHYYQYLLQIYVQIISTFKNSIFAKVINVSKHDVLNIRSKPDYKSPKIGEVAPSTLLGIDTCQRDTISTWCKVSILINVEFVKTGWVNAFFLELESKDAHRGYVKITGKPNHCYYSIKCEDKVDGFMCLVGSSKFITSKSSTKWININNLSAGTAFDSAPGDADGYCINGKMIDEAYRNKVYK